jgi:2-(1,2-epoxy-1,2-dihydrophenyl)acetyl-CoA isomerase
MPEVIELERVGSVAVVTLNRPESLNALNQELREAILLALEEVRLDDSVRVVVLTGAGRGFCSGADLSGVRNSDDELSQTDRLDEYGWVGRQALAVFGLDKPTIAAVNGVAVGAGMSLALACDIRIGGPATRFKTVFLERSLSPDAGMTYFLTRILGYAKAAELIFTNRSLDSNEALALGLLNRAAEEEGGALSEAIEVAEQIAQWPPLAVRASKRVLQHNLEVVLSEALLYEKAGLRLASLATNDRRESFESFRERRPPKFTGT